MQQLGSSRPTWQKFNFKLTFILYDIHIRIDVMSILIVVYPKTNCTL